MEFKELWKFELPNEVEEETQVEEKDKESGETRTVIKKEKINRPDYLKFKKPTRRDIESAQEEYAVELSRCIRKGIVTKAMLAKRYRTEGGPLTDEEQKGIDELYTQLEGAQLELTELRASKKRNTKTKEKELVAKIANLRKAIADFESSYHTLFQNTADSKAEVKAVTWYMLNLLYLHKHGEDAPVKLFPQKDVEDQVDAYYKFLDDEDEDAETMAEGLKNALTVASLLYYGGSLDPEEYEEVVKLSGHEEE